MIPLSQSITIYCWRIPILNREYDLSSHCGFCTNFLPCKYWIHPLVQDSETSYIHYRTVSSPMVQHSAPKARERERNNQNRLCLDPSSSTHTIVAPPLNMPLFPAQLMELRIAQQKAKTVRMAMYGAAGAAMLGAAVAVVAGGRAPLQLGGWRR